MKIKTFGLSKMPERKISVKEWILVAMLGAFITAMYDVFKNYIPIMLSLSEGLTTNVISILASASLTIACIGLAGVFLKKGRHD